MMDLDILLRMADDYASDAKHFMESVRDLGAINYAHAWIDAHGLLDGHGDDNLFTLP